MILSYLNESKIREAITATSLEDVLNNSFLHDIINSIEANDFRIKRGCEGLLKSLVVYFNRILPCPVEWARIEDISNIEVTSTSLSKASLDIGWVTLSFSFKLPDCFESDTVALNTFIHSKAFTNYCFQYEDYYISIKLDIDAKASSFKITIDIENGISVQLDTHLTSLDNLSEKDINTLKESLKTALETRLKDLADMLVASISGTEYIKYISNILDNFADQIDNRLDNGPYKAPVIDLDELIASLHDFDYLNITKLSCSKKLEHRVEYYLSKLDDACSVFLEFTPCIDESDIKIQSNMHTTILNVPFDLKFILPKSLCEYDNYSSYNINHTTVRTSQYDVWAEDVDYDYDLDSSAFIIHFSPLNNIKDTILYDLGPVADIYILRGKESIEKGFEKALIEKVADDESYNACEKIIDTIFLDMLDA